jgi:preprotein translocase subunit SecA
MLREVRRAHKTGQPLLIGTTSVETSELIADALAELNITAQVYNIYRYIYYRWGLWLNQVS